MSFTVKSNFPRGRFITSLFRMRRPSAITRLIVSVDIDSIYRMTGRFFSHVSEKIGKRLLPAITDFNPTAAVTGISLIFGILTASLHGAPRTVSWTGNGSRAVAVFGVMGKVKFMENATARLRDSASQNLAKQDFFVTALTTAAKHTPSLAIVQGSFQNSPTAKGKSRNINGFHNTIIRDAVGNLKIN